MRDKVLATPVDEVKMHGKCMFMFCFEPRLCSALFNILPIFFSRGSVNKIKSRLISCALGIVPPGALFGQ